jgi:hypothetical protein
MDGNKPCWLADLLLGVPLMDALARAPDDAGDDARAAFGPRLTVAGANAGRFRVWSLRELDAFAPPPQAPAGGRRISFDVAVRAAGARDLSRVEVSALQARATPGTLFQVASNFNALEVPSSRTPIGARGDGRAGDDEDGARNATRFLSFLMLDHTQGPAAASGAGVAAVARLRGAFFDAAVPPSAWAMTATRQVELLGDAALAPHLPIVNGKLFCDAGAPRAPWPPLDAAARARLLGAVRAGVHTDVDAAYERCADGSGSLRGARRVAAPPRIHQVFVAAMDASAAAEGVAALPAAERDEIRDFLLDAAYAATFAAAAVLRAPRVVLTLVGGGVFRNPIDSIARAAARALAAWAPRCPALEAVELPIFPAGAVRDAAIIADAARGIEGVDVRVVTLTDGDA